MTTTNKVFYWLLLISSLSGFCLTYFPAVLGEPVHIWWQELIATLSYFTIISNLLISVLAASQLFFSRSEFALRMSSMTVQTALAVYITITGVVYHLLLANTWTPEGITIISDKLLHTITPVLYVVFWWVCARGKTLPLKRTLSMLSVPLLYMLYWLIRGAIINSYPYFFIDVATLGYGPVLLNGLFLCLGFWLVAAFYWSLSRFTTPLYV